MRISSFWLQLAPRRGNNYKAVRIACCTKIPYHPHASAVFFGKVSPGGALFYSLYIPHRRKRAGSLIFAACLHTAAESFPTFIEKKGLSHVMMSVCLPVSPRLNERERERKKVPGKKKTKISFFCECARVLHQLFETPRDAGGWV